LPLDVRGGLNVFALSNAQRWNASGSVGQPPTVPGAAGC